jgi:molecular chaperone IbpA
MRHFDLSPLYRSTIGFDRLFSILDSLTAAETAQSYPPYNIERTGENAYRITMAVAGFSEDELDVEVHQNLLTVKGARREAEDGEKTEVLFQGIARRGFERKFQLAEHVEVVGAELSNGLLHIDLKREVPEQMKPRRISIAAAPAGARRISTAQAA